MVTTYFRKDFGTNRVVIFLYISFLIFSLSPWFFWGDIAKLTYYSISILITALTFIIILYRKYHKKAEINLFILLFILVIWTFLPIRDYDALKVTFFIQISAICILLQNRYVQEKVKIGVYNVYALVNLIFVLTWFLYIIKIPFFNIIIDNPDRNSIGFFYTMYYGVVYLNTQVIDLSFISFFRNHGFFAEPGHLGMFNLLYLSVYISRHAELKYKICVISSILTFSLPTLVCLVFLYFINTNVKSFKKILVILTLVVISSFLMNSLVDVYNATIGYKLERGETFLDILDSRTQGLAYLPIMSTIDFAIGYGREIFVSKEVIVADYRSILFKYGMIYYLILAFILFYMSLVKYNRNNLIAFTVVTIIIVLQRSWFLDTGVYMFFLCLCYLEEGGILNIGDANEV